MRRNSIPRPEATRDTHVVSDVHKLLCGRLGSKEITTHETNVSSWSLVATVSQQRPTVVS